MTVECLAILAIVAATSLVYLRAGKRGYAAVISILLVLPGVHLVMRNTVGHELVCAIADVVALAVTCGLIGYLVQTYIQGKTQRLALVLVTWTYSIVLAAIFIFIR